MIAYLRGIVRYLDEHRTVLDVGGLGYEVLLPAIEAKSLRTRLVRQGEGRLPDEPEVALWTYYQVTERQPRPVLIGFQERQDREFFELLLSVADIGPTLAARSMAIPVCDYASAIEGRDIRTLSSLPGIGKRKADQIIATLKGKALPYALLPPPEIDEQAVAAAADDFIADAEAVLEGLGHKHAEVVRMIEAARKRRPDIQDTQSLLEEIWRGEKPA